MKRQRSKNKVDGTRKFETKSAHAQLAEVIERDLRRNIWTGLLPSIRKLSVHYGSNLVTVFAATQLLIERGLLVSQGPKRRHLIHRDVNADQDMAGFNKVALIVATSKQTKTRPIARAKLFSQANDFCLVDLGSCTLQAFSREIKAFFASHRPSHVILIGGDPEHIACLDQLGIKVSLLHLDTVDWAPVLAELP